MLNLSVQRSILVIVNPAAGQRRRPYFEATLRALRELGVAVIIRATTGPGSAEVLARNALDEHFDVIVAAGGDGTIAEVVNGIAGAPQPFAILPLGTANVMAAEIGLGSSPEAVARVIAAGAPRAVYFALAGGRIFTLMAGAGIDARIVGGVNLALKRKVGKLAYAWQTLHEIANYRPTLYEVTINGETHRAAGVVVANGHFYGGRYVCAPEARLDQPLLHVCLFMRPGRLHALRYSLGLISGRLCRMPECDYRILPTRSLHLAGPAEERMQLDGDVGVRLPAAIEVIEEPFYLVCPECMA